MHYAPWPHLLLLVVLLFRLTAFDGAGVCSAEENRADLNLETVRLQLKWRHQFQFAGFYAAIAKGYYREEGLEVELIEGQPGQSPAGQLLEGRAEFAVDSPGVLLARQRGEPYVVLAAIFQHSPTMLMSLRGNGLTRPRDFRGRKVMITPVSDPEVMAMFALDGIGIEDLQVEPHSWNVDELMEGRVDGQSAYLTNEPFLVEQQGGEATIIKPFSYGIDFYGDCIITTEHEALEHPERVDAFLSATQRGWQYAMGHQREIIDLILSRYQTEKARSQLMYEALAMRELIQPDFVDIGYMSAERWRHIAATYVKLGMMEPGYSLDGFLYTELREKIRNERQWHARIILATLIILLLAAALIGGSLLLFNTRLAKLVRERTEALATSEQSFRAFFELASVGVGQIAAETGALQRINRKYCEILGYSAEEMLTRTILDLTHPDDQERDRETFQMLQSGKIPEYTTEKRYFHRNGEVVWVILTVSPVCTGNEGKAAFFIVLIRDITVRKLVEDKLLLAANVFDNSIEGIVVTDTQGTIEQVNPAFTAITGYAPEEAIGSNPRILKSDRHSPEFYEEMWHQIKTEGRWAGEIWNRRKSGEPYPEWLTINAIHNAEGRLTHYVSIFHDITELKQQQDALVHQAQHDALTGLPNRILFHDRLRMALRRLERRGSKLALLFIDMDNFKTINDGLGHSAGDQLLIEFSGRLAGLLRSGDTLARHGGDEFLILLPEVEDLDAVVHVAMRLLESLKTPFRFGEAEFFVTASIGITMAPDDGQEADKLIKNADMAMYKAKEVGRDTFQCFTAEMDALAQQRITLERKLRRGLEGRELELHYQPLINIVDGRIIGAEALVRWRHGDTLVPPAHFIPLAEESGLILPLGEWVLREAANQARRWQQGGLPINVSVNISARQFAGLDLPRLLREVLWVTGLSPGRMYFEITESTLMGDFSTAERILLELRTLGVKFFLDDFGTGYSSLSYLKRLPIDGLKIDRSFIRDIVEDPDSRAIAGAIVSMAENLNLSVVAEGVETLEQWRLLASMHPMLLQGFLISKPLPAQEFELFCRRGPVALPTLQIGEQ